MIEISGAYGGSSIMRSHLRIAWAGALSLALGGLAITGRAQDPVPAPASSPATPSTAPVVAFTGTWDYNDKESVNAANGRPEQGTPGQRRSTPMPSGGGATAGAPTGDPSGRSGGIQRSGMYGPPQGYAGVPPGFSNPNRLSANEVRSILRDLMEVPETLFIEVTPDAVKMTDDLKRALTFTTNGKSQKQRLSASNFETKSSWQNGQLRVEVEAARGFRMQHTYFLSEDGNRLFMIVRVGDPTPDKKDTPVVGVDRVYDRVPSSSK
jgi:hypothetical protein